MTYAMVLPLITVFGCLVVGCAESSTAQRAIAEYHAGRYTAAQQILDPLARQTDGDFVLNNVRLGSTMLAQGKLDEAEAAFERACEVINSAGINKGAREVAALTVSERAKIWKGEPFERAMASFYLGLICQKRGDYGNAKAAFENALFKLQDYDKAGSATQCAESDFVIAHLMLGRCCQRLNDQAAARAWFSRASSIRPQVSTIADYDVQQRSNVLLIIDYGHGPQRDYVYSGRATTSVPGNTTTTPYAGEFKGFAPRPADVGSVPQPQITIDEVLAVPASLTIPPIDLLQMAQQKRWQALETIQKVRSNTVDVVTFLGGPVGIVVGTIAHIVTDPDDRQWGMLPRTVFIVPLRLEPGHHAIDISFPDGSTPSARVQVETSATGDVVAYARMTPPFQPLPIKYTEALEAMQ